jgi:hypothetical protein
LAVALGLAVLSCQGQNAEAPAPAESGVITTYWSGGAEISRYQLSQARYGEQRDGDAVLIFVREPFLPEEQVKDESGGEGVPTLKLNSTRKFLTGIYPYSTMVSVFQAMGDASLGQAFKVTTSVQEWCGHVFVQTNRTEANTKTVVRSYFENEEGRSYRAKDEIFLEDEIWTTLRLAPESLPEGSFEMIPGSLYGRFAHREPTPALASAQWLPGREDETVRYRVEYPELKRFLAIEIERKAPFAILGWSEGRNGEVTEATRTHQLIDEEYWRKNGNQDRSRRTKLGLDATR